jgi:hypothetical protein
MEEKSEQLVIKILDFFSNRKGFDYWFQDLDEEIQNDIRECLAEVIAKELEKT